MNPILKAVVKATDTGLARLQRNRRRAISRALRGAKAIVRKDIRAHQTAKQSSDGSRWAKRKFGDGRRRLLGRLPRSIILKSSATSLSAVSRVPWADAHQEGKVVGRGVKLPQREFLWVGDAALGELETMTGRELLNEVGP